MLKASIWPKALILAALLVMAATLARPQGPAPASATAELPLKDRLQPTPRDSGFRMDGYYVWCGSVIKADGGYHMFASRWPVSTGFSGYLKNSEIVRAFSKTPLGPYQFQEVVIGQREPGHWDSDAAHNPVIYKAGDEYVVFYIASDFFPAIVKRRRIGYAVAKSITGPWQRSDQALDLGKDTDANNPSALFDPDGSVKLMWRDRALRTYISVAPSFRGPYRIVNDNVWPTARIEDFFFFRHKGKYMVLCEDNVAKVTGHDRWGALICSEDGVNNWSPCDPVIGYDHDIRMTDNTVFTPERRERPWLLIEDGQATFLFSAAKSGKSSWNQPVPISPPYPAQ